MSSISNNLTQDEKKIVIAVINQWENSLATDIDGVSGFDMNISILVTMFSDNLSSHCCFGLFSAILIA